MMINSFHSFYSLLLLTEIQLTNSAVGFFVLKSIPIKSIQNLAMNFLMEG